MSLKAKKICIVGISLARGGAERAMALQSKIFTDLGYEVHIIILNDDIDYPFAGIIFNLGKTKTGKDNFLKRFWRMHQIRKYVNQHNFDFLVDHRPKDEYFKELLYAKYAYQHLKNRIYVVHSARKETYLTDKPYKISSIYNKNYATVAVSNYIKTELLPEYGIKKTTQIYNSFYEVKENAMGEFPEMLKDKKYILSYGRLVDATKDFRFLIRSFEASRLWQHHIHLVIMGKGPDLQMLKDYAQQTQARDKILFLPFQKEPFLIIKNSRFVTLTSNYEGFPMVLLESLSLGTPVVSLDIKSGPSEIIQHQKNGLLVKNRDEKDFANAMKLLWNDEALYAEIKKNTSLSLNKFSLEKIISQWEALFENTSV